MKLLKKLSILAALLAGAYIPVCAFLASSLDLYIRFRLPAVSALIPLLITLGALAIAFVVPGSVGIVSKIFSIALIPVSAINFAVYFIYSESSAGIVLCALSFILASVLATKTVRFIAFRILIPLCSAGVGIITFALAVILAVAVGLGRKDVLYIKESPNREYRVELTEQNLSSNGVSLVLYEVKKDTRLPFVSLVPDGKALFSGKLSDKSSLPEWKDGRTVIFDGKEFSVK